MFRWRVAALVLLLALVALPLTVPFFELAPAQLRGGQDRLLTLAGNTLFLVAGTLAVALPLGTAAAVLLYRTDLPLRGFFRFLTVLTLFVPLPVLTTAWQAALGSGGWFHWPLFVPQTDRPWAEGMGPAVWIHTQAALPWVILIVGQGLRWVPPELEEDALLLTGAWTVLWRVTLPQCRGAIAAAAVWVALQVSTELTVADLMLVRTIAEEVYAQFWGGGEEALARALAAALPMVLLTALGTYVVLGRIGALVPSLDALLTRPRLFHLGGSRWLFLLGTAVAVGVLAGVPVAALVRTTGSSGQPTAWSAAATLQRLTATWNSDAGLIAGSIVLAFGSGAVAATLALIACWLAVDSLLFRRLLFGVVVLAWSLPGPIVGIGLKETIFAVVYWVSFHPLSVALYYGPSPLPVLWAHLVRFLPCAVVALWPVVRLVPRDLRDSLRLDGGRPLQELLLLQAPLLWRAWLAVAVVVAALALGEIGAVAMRVETPGWNTFAHELFRRMHYGLAQDVSALCLLMVVMLAAAAIVISVLIRALPRLAGAIRPARPVAH
jgi:iron(III) transport system permease protein